MRVSHERMKKMKSALIGLDATSSKNPSIDQFLETIGLFQKKGFFLQATIASVIHAGLYALPHSWYNKMRKSLSKEALATVGKLASTSFQYQAAKILYVESAIKEDLVACLCRYGKRKAIDVLILASSDRVGVPYWILGSVSETAALTAAMPVMIIKPRPKNLEFSREVRFVVGVDAANPFSSDALLWIANAAHTANVRIDLVYVEPKKRWVIDAVKGKKNQGEASEVLGKMQSFLLSHGVKCAVTLLKESQSIAHTFVEFADQRKAWLTLTVAVKRSKARKIIFGSSARRILLLTKRPFLSLRFIS